MVSRRSFVAGIAGAALSRSALAGLPAHRGGVPDSPQLGVDPLADGGDEAVHQHADSALVPVIREWQRQSPHTAGVAVGVRFPDGRVWNRGFGLADLRTRRPMPANGYMRVGSVTKTFTGTVLLQLVDAGLIGLDDPLSGYIRGAIPQVPNADRITIRMLGDMSSGLYDYVDLVEPDFDPAAEVWRTPFTPSTPRRLVEIGLSQPPYFAPGQGWQYSNTNFVILGMLIEELTKRPLRENIRSRILRPLGLGDTLFPLHLGYPRPHPRGYSLKPPEFKSLVEITYIQAASGAWACGNMISTPRDMLAYAKPLATGRLVSEAAQRERTRWLDATVYKPPRSPFTDQKYGFALKALDGLIGHGGNIQGYETFLAYLPAADASIVVISNLYLTNDPGLGSPGLAKRIAELLLSKAI